MDAATGEIVQPTIYRKELVRKQPRHAKMQMQARNTCDLEMEKNNLFTRARKEENKENRLNGRTNVSTNAFHRTGYRRAEVACTNMNAKDRKTHASTQATTESRNKLRMDETSPSMRD